MLGPQILSFGSRRLQKGLLYVTRDQSARTAAFFWITPSQNTRIVTPRHPGNGTCPATDFDNGCRWFKHNCDYCGNRNLIATTKLRISRIFFATLCADTFAWT